MTAFDGSVWNLASPDGSTRELVLERAHQDLLAGRLDDAEGAVDKELRRLEAATDPDVGARARGLVLKGSIARRRGDADGAGRLFQAGRELLEGMSDEGLDARTWFDLALARFGTGDPGGAEGALEEASGRGHRGPELFRLAGELALARGDAETARHMLSRAAESIVRDPDLLAGLGEACAGKGRGQEALEHFVTAGAILGEEGRLAEAEACFHRAVELPWPDARALALRGETRRLLGKLDGAMEDFREALELDPDQGLARSRRAEILRVLGHREEALADLDQALETVPDDPFVHGTRGAILLDIGALDQARRDLDRALELEPDYAFALASRGELHRMAGRLQEAVDDLTRAVRLDDTQGMAMASLGAALLAAPWPDASAGAEAARQAVAVLSRAIELNPEYAFALYHRAQALRVLDAPDAALADLDRAVELMPEDATLHLTRGEILSGQERLQEALAAVEAAASIDPENGAIATRLAMALWQAGRLEDALASSDRAVQLDAEDPQARVIRGAILGAMGRQEEGVEELSRAIGALPDHAWAHLQRGLLRVALGDQAGAVEDLARCEELDPELGTPALWRIRAQALETLKRFDEALVDWDRAIEQTPDDPHLWALRGDTLRLKAVALGLATPGGREVMDEALRQLRRGVEGNPEDGWAHAALGTALSALKRDQEALEHLDRALEADPEHFFALDQRTSVLQRLGRVDDGLDDLSRMVELQPDNVNALGQRGDLLRTLGRFQEALEDLDRAVAIDPDDSFARGTRGAVLATVGRNEEALEDLGRALELDPDYGFALRQRGDLLRVLGREQEAIADLDHALELDDGSAFAHGTRGACLVSLGSFEEALPALDRALELDPEYGFAATMRGEALRMLDRYDEAEEALTRAIELDPEAEVPWGSRAEVRRCLQRLADAEEDARHALELADDRYPFGRGVLGRVLFDGGRFDEAHPELQRTLDEDPELVWVAQLKGYCEIYLERGADAEATFRGALALDATDPFSHTGLGHALALLGRKVEAREHFETVAAAIDPTRTVEPGRLTVLGTALTELGRPREGMVAMVDAMSAEPDDPEIQLELGRATMCAGRYELGLEEYRQALERVRRAGLEPGRIVGLARQALLDLQRTIEVHGLADGEALQGVLDLLMAEAEAAPA